MSTGKQTKARGLLPSEREVFQQSISDLIMAFEKKNQLTVTGFFLGKLDCVSDRSFLLSVESADSPKSKD